LSTRDETAARVRARTAQEAARGGPERARRQALRALDEALARIPVVQRGNVACRSGCDLCCHLRVMATPAEVFGVVDFLKAQLDPASFAAFRDRVADTARRLVGLPRAQVLATNLPCPVLVDGRCSAYAARPFNCRAYHSLDRDACQQSFDNPADTTLNHPQYGAVARVHEGVQAGHVAGLADAGFDSKQYELVTALAEALDDPQARERFDRRARAFERPSPV
jgi:Fe-S-cluster containining protein